MKVEFAFLADAATLQPDGLFAVVGGGFDVITGKDFPLQKPVMVVVARINYGPDEYGPNHAVAAEIVDHKGKRIFPVLDSAFTAVPHPRYPDRGNWITVCLNAVGADFPAPGDYAVRLSVDGKHLGDLAFEVVREEVPK
jgi:hypothetical protein